MNIRRAAAVKGNSPDPRGPAQDFRRVDSADLATLGFRRAARRAADLRPAPAEVTAAVTRGVCRWLDDQGFAALTEFKLANRRRADIVGISTKGTILMVEVKSTPEDFRGDAKWLEYIPYCDAFAFAVPPHFPWHILPDTCGVIVADAHTAALMRAAPHHPLHGSRRKALTLQFALAAGQRLQGIVDPRL
jgi:hypothetical protein